MSYTVINPVNEQQGPTWPLHTSEQVDELIAKAREAFHHYRSSSFAHRAKQLNSAARLLRERKEQYARLITGEMGKPVTQSRGEIEKCAWVCEYYAEHGASFLASRAIETEASDSRVTYSPLGIVLAIMPWNFPFWQVFRFAAPTLMAGNAALLKHAPNVPGCCEAIDRLLSEAGFPEHLFKALYINTDEVPRILADCRVCAATLTGSNAAGSAVAETAGNHLKKTVLELGGSDPYLILEDADVEEAARTCVTSRLINTGQSCIAAKRFIVTEPCYDEFLEAVMEQMQGYKMGDPMDEDTQLGPLARADLRDRLHTQTTESVRMGARCQMGGFAPDEAGVWYPPTVLTDVQPGMPVFDQETFGPVAAVIRAGSEREAIDLANRSRYGLGAAVFTGDRERGKRIATEELQAGCCHVNDFVKSDPRLPFGGVKESGYGRELSHLGIREFVNIKTVSVA